MDEVRQWQTRPLEAIYPIVYVDCLMVNVRENQRVLKKALAPFASGQLGRTERTARHVDRPNGRGEILVVSAHRGAKPRRQGYLYRVCGWAHRLARSH